MALLVFCLSARGRSYLQIVVLSTCVTCACVCVSYLGYLLYSFIRHSFLLHELIISLFDDVFYNLMVHSVLILLFPIVYWKIFRNLLLQPTNYSLSRSYYVSTAFVLLSLVSTIVCVIVMSKMLWTVKEKVGPRYRYGMSLYLEDPEWQITVDRIQDYLECCGADSHTDWYTYTWIPIRLLHVDPELYSKVVKPDGQLLAPIVPDSCCREPGTDCGQEAWLKNKERSWNDAKAVDPQLIHSEGCAQTIIKILGGDFLIFKILLLLIIVLQMVMVVGMRYLFTSTVNSILLGVPRGSAPGWLFGTDLTAYSKYIGRTSEKYDKAYRDEEPLLDVQDDPPKKKKLRKYIDKLSPKIKIKKILKSPYLSKLRRKKARKGDDSHLPETSDLTSDLDSETVTTEVKTSKTINNTEIVTAKISKNLIDLELAKPQEELVRVEVYEAGTKHKNPFVNEKITGKIKTGAIPKQVTSLRKSQPVRENVKVRQRKAISSDDSTESETELEIQRSRNEVGTKHKNVLVNEEIPGNTRIEETTKQVMGLRKIPSIKEQHKPNSSNTSSKSEIERDFQKTRSLFENVDKREEPVRRNVNPYNTKHEKQQNLVELDEMPDKKKTTNTVPSSAPSKENKNPPPVILRNYRMPPKK